MQTFNKNDKVTIINTNDIWENKKGVVISDTGISDEVVVKVIFDTDKKILQHFSRDNLQLDSTNEVLLEEVTITDQVDFINKFTGKRCTFNGFRYNELYAKKEQNDGSFEYEEEDLVEINYYRMLEDIPCEIISCAIIDGFDVKNSLKENFNSCYWDVEFDNNDILSAVSGENLTLLDVSLEEALLENKERKKFDTDDFIKDYVYTETMDEDKIPSWFFAKKIAEAENVNQQTVLNVAKHYKYKIYRITAPLFDNLVIAAANCTEETIYNDYAEYLQGPAIIKEEK